MERALPALPAGGPFTLVIQGKKEITIKDVLIGEVWIASGQSNMTFSLGGSEGAEIEVPKANYPQIRLLPFPRRLPYRRREHAPAHWQICTPDTAKEFSAVAYFFAREIHRRENVPIGVVESAWPGTSIQEWIAPEVLQTDAETRELVDNWNRATPAEKQFAETSLPFELDFDDFD